MENRKKQLMEMALGTLIEEVQRVDEELAQVRAFRLADKENSEAALLLAHKAVERWQRRAQEYKTELVKAETLKNHELTQKNMLLHEVGVLTKNLAEKNMLLHEIGVLTDDYAPMKSVADYWMNKFYLMEKANASLKEQVDQLDKMIDDLAKELIEKDKENASLTEQLDAKKSSADHWMAAVLADKENTSSKEQINTYTKEDAEAALELMEMIINDLEETFTDMYTQRTAAWLSAQFDLFNRGI